MHVRLDIEVARLQNVVTSGPPVRPCPARCPTQCARSGPCAPQQPFPPGCTGLLWASQALVPSAHLNPRFQGQEPPGFPGRFSRRGRPRIRQAPADVAVFDPGTLLTAGSFGKWTRHSRPGDHSDLMSPCRGKSPMLHLDFLGWKNRDGDRQWIARETREIQEWETVGALRTD
jgi:hypothetical protein